MHISKYSICYLYLLANILIAGKVQIIIYNLFLIVLIINYDLNKCVMWKCIIEISKCM